jgi:hypothetical protein
MSSYYSHRSLRSNSRQSALASFKSTQFGWTPGALMRRFIATLLPQDAQPRSLLAASLVSAGISGKALTFLCSQPSRVDFDFLKQSTFSLGALVVVLSRDLVGLVRAVGVCRRRIVYVFCLVLGDGSRALG